MTDFLTQQFEQIDEILRGAKRVLVASHEHPDADAVSSALTLSHYLKKENIENLLYLPDPPPQHLSFLPGFFGIKTEIGDFDPDLLLCLDYGDFKRLKIPQSILDKDSLKIITIDHHVESDQRGQVKIVEPKLSSTAEIIYHWLRFKNLEIDKDFSTCLLAGIISDSGGFRHIATSSETLKIVSDLLSTGVSLNKIIRQTLAFDQAPHLSRSWGKVLSRTEIDPATTLAYSWITFEELEKLKARLADFDGITNLISAASPTNLGLFLIEYDSGKIKGSLRSEPGRGRDVVKIAKALGGGGHPYAAGFQQEGNTEEVLKKVIKLI